MKWVPEKKDYLREHWLEQNDQELANALGATKEAVRVQRQHLDLDRTAPNIFVVQITDWLPSQRATNYWCEYLQSTNLEHIVAQSESGFAIFRRQIKSMFGERVLSTVAEPPKASWVWHWEPK